MKNFKHQLSAIILLFVLLSNSKTALANAAQPGVWSAGGTVFTMLYPQDSLTFKKVQMATEKIYIQLYKGYAVVKGTYVFKNTTNEKLSFKMGYPVNGIYSGGEVDYNQVLLDSLSKFKIRSNGNWLPLVKQENYEYGRIQNFSENWMVWQMVFSPNETRTVEVYFMVNTNNGQISKGYNTNHYNAFIYLLESGSVWKNPIEKGNFYIQLRDGIEQKNVKGLSAGFDFKYNAANQLYAGTKTNFSPTAKDNVVVTYAERNESFNFETAARTSELHFDRIDSLSNVLFENLVYQPVTTEDPYLVSSTIWGYFPMLLMLFVIYAPFIIGAIVIFIAIWTFVKWRKRKNKI